jgi:hypothetical protein
MVIHDLVRESAVVFRFKNLVYGTVPTYYEENSFLFLLKLVFFNVAYTVPTPSS